jgi:hypothetical protein
MNKPTYMYTMLKICLKFLDKSLSETFSAEMEFCNIDSMYIGLSMHE